MHLPKDSRTVLNRPFFVASRFVHETAGFHWISRWPSEETECHSQRAIIDSSTDGGRLDKGWKWQFWPHQYRIINIPDKRPMIAGVFKFFEMFSRKLMKSLGMAELKSVVEQFLSEFEKLL